MSFVFAAEGDFDPQHEFLLDEWIPIHLGPLDMSVNKAVVYLWVGRAGDDLPRHLAHAFRPLAEARPPPDGR